MQTGSFSDIYRQILGVTSALLEGKLDAQRAMAYAANMRTLDGFINTEIKLRRLEADGAKWLNGFGDRRLLPPEAGPPESQTDALRQIANVPPKEVAVARGKKPKYGFVGLTPHEAGEVSAAYAEFADLKFWKDEGNPKLKALGTCDVVFINKSQTSHATMGFLVAHGNPPTVLISGGVGTMIDAVRNRANSDSK